MFYRGLRLQTSRNAMAARVRTMPGAWSGRGRTSVCVTRGTPARTVNEVRL